MHDAPEDVLAVKVAVDPALTGELTETICKVGADEIVAIGVVGAIGVVITDAAVVAGVDCVGLGAAGVIPHIPLPASLAYR